MCGEIEEWQYAKAVTVRLTTSGAQTNVVLGNRFAEVEEIRLNEVMVTGFNGGVSACAYLRIFQDNMTHATANNEANSGLLVPIDVLNPHQVYNNPRPVSQGNRVNINQFGIALLMPNGTAATFTEACFVLTFVCRRSADSLEEVRRLKASVAYLPTIKDVRTTFNPNQ